MNDRHEWVLVLFTVAFFALTAIAVAVGFLALDRRLERIEEYLAPPAVEEQPAPSEVAA